MRQCPIACVPRNDAEVVHRRHLRGIAEVLDDLQRVAQREHLAAGHILEVVGERLQVALVAHQRPVGVLGLGLDPVDVGADLAEPRLHLQAVALQAFTEVEVPRVVRVGQLEPDHDQVARRAEQARTRWSRARDASSTAACGHLRPDVGLLVAMDDACDAAHVGSGSFRLGACRYGRMSRYSSTSQSETVARNRSHSSRL